MDTTSQLTENIADFIKISAATSPPAAFVLFGLPLEHWMYIMSMTASLLFILDKAPAVIRRIYAKIRK